MSLGKIKENRESLALVFEANMSPAQLTKSLHSLVNMFADESRERDELVTAGPSWKQSPQ